MFWRSAEYETHFLGDLNINYLNIMKSQTKHKKLL